MIGLIAMLVIGIWIAVCIFLARRLPRWLGVKRFTNLASIAIFPLLFVAPTIDEVVGMRQFERLCKERAVAIVSPEAHSVKKAKRAEVPGVDLKGYWIDIQSQRFVYLDAATGKPFVSFESLYTKGGRVVGIAKLGNKHSCSPKNRSEISKGLDIDKLLKEGGEL
jgi:hypothetical protein